MCSNHSGHQDSSRIHPTYMLSILLSLYRYECTLYLGTRIIRVYALETTAKCINFMLLFSHKTDLCLSFSHKTMTFVNKTCSFENKNTLCHSIETDNLKRSDPSHSEGQYMKRSYSLPVVRGGKLKWPLPRASVSKYRREPEVLVLLLAPVGLILWPVSTNVT